MEFRSKVRTCLWFEKGGREAAEFYVSVIPNSTIDSVFDHHSPADPMVVEFTLAGAPMMILTAGPHFKLTPAASISVLTEDQAETDDLWDKLLAGGGEESQCGWLIDRFGVSWQIIPKVLPLLINQDDKIAGKRVQEAMMQMHKIDIAALEAASAGDST